MNLKHFLYATFIFISSQAISSSLEHLGSIALPHTGNGMDIKGAFTDLVNCKDIQWFDETRRGVKKAKVTCSISDVNNIDIDVRSQMYSDWGFKRKSLLESLEDKKLQLTNSNLSIKKRINEIKAIVNSRNTDIEIDIETATKTNNTLIKEIKGLSNKYATNKNLIKKINNDISLIDENNDIKRYKQMILYPNLKKISLTGIFIITVDGKELRDWQFYSTFTFANGTNYIYFHPKIEGEWPCYSSKFFPDHT